MKYELRCPQCHCKSLCEGVKVRTGVTVYDCLAKCGFSCRKSEENLEYIVLETLKYNRENAQWL